MRIAIFEKEHYEGAFPVIKLFDVPGNTITIITSADTHPRFLDLFKAKSNRYSWQILPVDSKARFFKALYRCLKEINPDILYINTISDNHLLYWFVLRNLHLHRTVMTVHDINCLFESRPSLQFRKMIIHIGKKRLLRRIDEFNVVADTMTAYLRTKTNKNSHNVPGSVFEERYFPQPISGVINIVVPGSLDKKRRDYKQVYELASSASKEGLSLNITLLGGYWNESGKSIAARAAEFQSDYCKIKVYPVAIVDQDEFDKQMDAAHFVFIPSMIKATICGDTPEIYGLTKSSGNIFDVIKHAKPFIVPAGLMVSQLLLTSCFRYNSIDEIVVFLKMLVHSPIDYDIWQRNALANSQNYTIEKVRERNQALFNGQIGNDS